MSRMNLSPFRQLLLWAALALTLCQPALAIWCDDDNCYDLLGVNQTATASEIRKSYYKLSLQLHPDKNPGDVQAQRRFAKIGAAYEILSNEDRRESYNYVLAHPERVLYNTARYYQTYYGPKSDIRWIVLGVMVIISGFQYFNDYVLYKKAIDNVKKSALFKRRLNALKQERLGTKGKVRARVKGSKAEDTVKELEEEVLKEVEVVGCAPPHWKRLLPWQLVMVVVNFFKWVRWEVEWTRKYRWKKEPYDREAQAYLTRKALAMPTEPWEDLDAEEQEELVERQLWVAENLDAYKNSKRKEMRRRR